MNKENFIKAVEMLIEKMNVKFTDSGEQEIYNSYFKVIFLPPFLDGLSRILGVDSAPILEYLYPTRKPSVHTPAELYDYIAKSAATLN